MANNGSANAFDARASYVEALSGMPSAEREAQIQSLQQQAEEAAQAEAVRSEAVRAAAEQQAAAEREAEAQAQAEREAAAREAAEHAALEAAQAEFQRQRAGAEAAQERARAEADAQGLQHRRLQQAARGAGERLTGRLGAGSVPVTSRAGPAPSSQDTVQQLQNSEAFTQLVQQLMEEACQTRQQTSSSKKFSAAVSVLSRRPFEEKSNRLETWLWLAELFLRKTGLERESWGEVIVQALADGPSEAVRIQLESTADPALLSYDNVVEVLTSLYSVKETTCGIQTKLEQLQLSRDSLPAFLGYRDAFTSLCSKISEKDLPSSQRCRIFLFVLFC